MYFIPAASIDQNKTYIVAIFYASNTVNKINDGA